MDLSFHKIRKFLDYVRLGNWYRVFGKRECDFVVKYRVSRQLVPKYRRQSINLNMLSFKEKVM